jgi:anaerobic selenocysteine-containing dehydrogenase
MNRLGAALLGEIIEPPIKSLYVFAANPASSAPNSAAVLAGLKREDLFTVVHELYMTDTADYADIVLPATSQLEQTDLHKAYGHTYLTYNQPAIPPLAECKSNWDVIRELAKAMSFQDDWLRQDADEVIDEVLVASSQRSTLLEGISLDRLKNEGSLPLDLDIETPFADGHFPTPSGKVELYSLAMIEEGVDPLPRWDEKAQDDGALKLEDERFKPDESLILVSGANHFSISSSLANQPELLQGAGPATVLINPRDAGIRGIKSGDQVMVENGRGWVSLRAVVSDDVRVGVLASAKGRWHKLEGGHNINWTTSDALADVAGQSVYHSTRVWVRPDGTLK